jgi:peptide deformylase
MIRQVLNATDPKLRLKSKPVVKVDKKVLSLIKDLKDTLVVQKDPEGIGLAAPQIGKNLRVFVIKPAKELLVFINPKIQNSFKSKSKTDNKIMEGCLSLPHHYGPLKRAEKIKVKYLTEKGDEVSEEFKALEAQIIQHEIDHLNGVLFIDRLLEQKKPLYEFINGEWEKVEI